MYQIYNIKKEKTRYYPDNPDILLINPKNKNIGTTYSQFKHKNFVYGSTSKNSKLGQTLSYDIYPELLTKTVNGEFNIYLHYKILQDLDLSFVNTKFPANKYIIGTSHTKYKNIKKIYTSTNKEIPQNTKQVLRCDKLYISIELDDIYDISYIINKYTNYSYLRYQKNIFAKRYKYIPDSSYIKNIIDDIDINKFNSYLLNENIKFINSPTFNSEIYANILNFNQEKSDTNSTFESQNGNEENPDTLSLIHI